VDPDSESVDRHAFRAKKRARKPSLGPLHPREWSNTREEMGVYCIGEGEVEACGNFRR